MIANMKREIAMGKSSYSSRATTSSRNSCEYISSSRRDCSIISISRVNRATPRPVTRFSRHRSACTLCQGRGDEQCGATRNVQKEGESGGGSVTALSPREERESRPRKENKRRSRIDHEKVARFKRRRKGCSFEGCGDENGGGCLRGVFVCCRRTERIWRIWNMIVEP